MYYERMYNIAIATLELITTVTTIGTILNWINNKLEDK